MTKCRHKKSDRVIVGGEFSEDSSGSTCYRPTTFWCEECGAIKLKDSKRWIKSRRVKCQD